MKTIKNLLFISLIVILLSCGGNNSKTSDSQNDVVQNNDSETSAEVKSKGKYQIKSGIVTYTSQVMKMDQTTVITFDDYGNKEVTDTYTEAMGVKLHSRTIVKDGYAYNLNMDEKSGSKVKMYGSGSAIDYTNLTKDIEEKMNMKKLGTETILGKECEIYSFDYKEMSTKGTTWIWKGVALKSVVNSMGMEVTLTGTSFDDNPKIDQNIFNVPEGFNIIER
jgi:hypothetical protein